RTPLALIQEALRAARLQPEQIEVLAVGLGPGSYTGIRAAIAIAQGWQLARTVRLLGLSSAECLAAQALAAGCRGRVAIAIAAQRDEFHLAAYELAASGARLVEPLQLVRRPVVQARADQGEVLIGPELDARLPGARQFFPDAAVLGRLAEGRTDFVSGDCLQPLCLRQAAFAQAPPPRLVGLTAPTEDAGQPRSAPATNR
ncbi:MAG: tRNA (adenosine(37)-N6)-threonylcarbamoyltransferase complex dimerization subunit type 1 TsaB, partial [Verrucomicrobia bacterium]|nr:tRNA (adenosine(37)-N6)-threonylcarbamoyltransferase complex dimerization subunit type 1 TsaB [Verrucomicrobiota bacterium]